MEDSSLDDRMTNKNWSPKCKRKHKLSRLDDSKRKQEALILSESEKNISSHRKKLKGNLYASLKLKGHDEYFLDCEECNPGGNLLCCDDCPQTYHFDCLNPPLKYAPTGKWQCPKCLQKEVETLNAIQTSSNRVKSKGTIQKAKNLDNISRCHKTAPSKISSRRTSKSIREEGVAISNEIQAFMKKPSSKTNVPRLKPKDTNEGILNVGALTMEDSQNKKKAVSLSPRNTSEHKTVHSLVKLTKFSVNDKLSKEGLDTCKNEIHGKNLDLPVPPSSRISKKNRKIYKIGNNDITKSNNAKLIEYISNGTSGDCSPCSESSESPLKFCFADNPTQSLDKRQKIRLLRPTRKQQLEASLHSSLILSPNKLGESAENKMVLNEIFSGDVKQVDRILGCRIQTRSFHFDQTNRVAISPADNRYEVNLGKLQSKFPSADFSCQVNHDQLDDFSDDNRVKDIKDLAFTLDYHQGAANIIAKNFVGVSSDELGEDSMGKAFATSEHLGNAKISGSSILQAPMANCLEGNIASNKLLSEDCNDHTPIANLPVTCEPYDAHLMSLVFQKDRNVQNVKLNQAEPDLRPGEHLDTIYEFLVKWVGKSNIHNSWVSENQVKLLAKRKLENYKAKYGTAIINICEDQWCQPQRIISIHESDARREALVKWNGLSYDECTWEKLDDNLVQNSCYLISEFERFESQALDNDARDVIIKGETQVISLKEQPNELKGGLLFPHQLEALNWLRRCWYRSKNVILADEMGLGKTVSACSFISSLYLEFKVKLPCLVLVPLSTMPNWLAEFSSWAPHLNVVEYHGCARARSMIRLHEWHASFLDGTHKKTKSYKFNVLLTTYEMILADSFYLRGVPWELLVVDEGHRLKNSGSKLFNLLNSFSFCHRVLLTGTPLQNNIGEMFNLLSFLQPSSFPSLSIFEEKFNDLTTAEKVEELKKLVAPHMLRRLKKDTMQNIPPKTERMVPVELTSIQAEYYRAMLTKNYQILRNIGKGVAQQSMLNIVMQLRKVCNHPYLIPGTEPESGTAEFLQEMRIKASAKLNLLHNMLKILHKDGHRVLIFSQMTKLLDILEDYITIEFGHGTFERVDGSVSVTDRQAAIARFNKDKTRFVFLLSTRSCGLGINLATADTVVIYDSDFNPHADIQAMNRAHRIGQSNRLLVYRLVVRASVEERILQLAKKKLMLDQLFVNKSESQKEVEDILRWGTEELFGQSDGVNGQISKDNSISKVDSTTYLEHKHRRRVGGLGDVYKDKCTDGGSKIVWDESAILKLLDRSGLQTSALESADGDLDSDLLGSIKSLDWSDEQLTGELGGAEIATDFFGDGCEPNETKEDNTNTVTGENEWDRLLRNRWEKCQLEEEAALGRGKRLRKAVSYREAVTSIINVASSENANEDPAKDYSVAGRTLKDKYMKLRARQKERISKRNTVEAHSSAEGPESFLQSLLPDSKEVQYAYFTALSEDSSEVDPPAIPFESKHSQSFEAKNLKLGYKRYDGSHPNISVVEPPGVSSNNIPPNSHFQDCFTNCDPSMTALPILGLCAPNASRKSLKISRNSTTQNFNSPIRQQAYNQEHRRRSLDVQVFLSSPSVNGEPPIDANISSQESTDLPMLLDTPRETLHRLQNIIPDSYFPFGPPLLPTSRKFSSDPSKSINTSFSSYQKKMGIPSLGSDELSSPKYSILSKSSIKLKTDFLPNVSLYPNMNLGNGSTKTLSNVPLVPSFGQYLSDARKQKEVIPELPPTLNLNLLQTGHLLPENDMKDPDDIIYKTQNDVYKFMKKRLKFNAWLEDELDALWIGVRRHGKGNWDTILQDPKFAILKNRSVEELLSKWNEEQHKIMDGPLPPSKQSLPPPIFSESTSLLGLSDIMMARALHGSNFAKLGAIMPKFRSHFSAIRPGFGDIISGFPFLEPCSSHLGVAGESLPHLPSLVGNKVESSCTNKFSAGFVDRFERANLLLEQPFHQGFLTCSPGASGISFPGGCSPQQPVDVPARNKRMKLPSLLENSLRILHETENAHTDGSGKGVLYDAERNQVISKLLIKDENFPAESNERKLPHWLQEAVNNAQRAPEATLPSSISAILHSVRVLYGEDKLTIPPFLIPALPSPPPHDPRKCLRKKRMLSRLRQNIPENSNAPEVSSSILYQEPTLMQSSVPFSPSLILPAASLFPSSISLSPSMTPGSVPTVPRLMQCSTLAETLLMPCTIPLEHPLADTLPDLPRKETGSSFSSLNLNLNLPLSSYGYEGMHSCAASSVCHVPSIASISDMPCTSYHNMECPTSENTSELSHQIGLNLIGDSKYRHMEQKETMSSLLSCQEILEAQHVYSTDGGESSKNNRLASGYGHNNCTGEFIKYNCCS